MRARSQKITLGVVAAAALLLFGWHFLQWQGATAIAGATITHVGESEATSRRSTGQRYEVVVVHNGERLPGYFDTSWWVSAPRPGEIVGLRHRGAGDARRFYYENWSREFRPWFVMIPVFVIIGGFLYWSYQRMQARLQDVSDFEASP